MQLKPGFAFVPLPPIPEAKAAAASAFSDSPYGPLAQLPGHWAGTGFNMIWRPFHDPTGHTDHFLELNLTNETIDFALIEGPIPNRGLLQPDIAMYGVTYLQQISDATLSTPGNIVGLHAEPGIWATVPATSDPVEPPTVVRMASIPHGTTILAQGLATEQQGVPDFAEPGNDYPRAFAPHGSSTPFLPSGADLSAPAANRTPDKDLKNITQAMLDKPVETVLRSVLQEQTILSTITLAVSTSPGDKAHPTVPAGGGGVANTAFLQGNPGRSNAETMEVDSTFWIETVQGKDGAPDFLQLQYRQTVYLQFESFFWPHVTVATLRRQS